ncbi:MAG TPA: nitroreductase family deazaflavin-dependent oxidoreductase [Acidimicrobiales bacterium]|nr:nitroreductase family deazaflavin-dependent oxidoreductase [Acidimicrobiales bacterium]
MSEMNDFNTQIIEEFRANEGKVGRQFEGATVLLLTTKSGLTRVNPMMYLAEGERLFVFASKAGAPTNPDRFHNIVADPAVTVEVGSVRFAAVATVLEGDERYRVYAEQAIRYPGFAEYQAATDRIIPVVALDRR